jgi:hypothetical protein
MQNQKKLTLRGKMDQQLYSEVEDKVKELIRQSLQKRVLGLGPIDPDLDNENLVDRWLTDVMAIGFNLDDLNSAALDIYELQKPLEGILYPLILLEDIRNSIYHSSARFIEEICAFKQYVEFRASESAEIVLHEVKKTLADVGEGDFETV